ncbi:MAG: biopolymer transporter ExbD [Thermoguttaceae bacterium]|jgi:biopolymer transport protein ExbD
MAVTLHHKGSSPIFNLTPMIDCVFLLLVFFLVTTQLAEEERQVSVELPSASEALPLTSKPRELLINIDERGEYYVDAERLTLAQLDPVLKRAWVNNPDRQAVVIRADKRCRWQSVVAAMNVCQKCKIREYRVTTREGPE